MCYTQNEVRTVATCSTNIEITSVIQKESKHPEKQNGSDTLHKIFVIHVFSECAEMKWHAASDEFSFGWVHKRHFIRCEDRTSR